MSDFYALLIGIDYYQPNPYFSSLRGAVRDIENVGDYLEESRKIPVERITRLTSRLSNTNSRADARAERREMPPTYQNMVKAFKSITENAQTGDLVYIHYSGHGGRTKTLVPDLKGENGTDESLVPSDIGQPDGNYLRDIELAKLLQKMVDKGLIVTIILDSCHSGGATRGDTAIRGSDVIDEMPRSQDSLVASLEELTANWRSLTQKSTRGLNSGWLPESRDYVFLAACRPNEYAYETTFSGGLTGERNGALTHWWLDSLQQLAQGMTYKDLYDRVHAKVHSQFAQQTPMLLGEGNREVFGSELSQLTDAVPVIDVDKEKQRVLLETGQVAGMRTGAEFAIYSQKVGSYSDPQQRLAVARIVEYGATESWCNLEPIAGKEAVQQGDRAVLISASVNLVRPVLLFYQEEATSEELKLEKLPPNKLPPEVYQIQDSALQALKDALPGNGWVELATAKEEEEGEISYVVALNDKGEYEIGDRTGNPYPNLRPPLKAGTPDAAQQVVKRLVHLAKYHAIAELDNFDRNSPLMGKLEVEWLGKLSDYDPADPVPKKSQLEPLDDPTNATIAAGEWIFLRVRNNSQQDLNIAVLDLESDWSVEQVHPTSAAKFITLSPGQKEDIPFRLSLLEGYKEGTDVAKVFAAVGEPNFRWLELPSLDEPLEPKGITRKMEGSNPLEDLLVAIDDEQPKTRRLNPAQYPSREWVTKQVSVIVLSTGKK